MPPRIRRTSPTPTPTNSHWIISDSVSANGRHVEPGVEVKITGQGSIRFVFKRHVRNPANGAEWIDVFGGPKGSECIRSFRPSSITTVHRLRKARAK